MSMRLFTEAVNAATASLEALALVNVTRRQASAAAPAEPARRSAEPAPSRGEPVSLSLDDQLATLVKGARLSKTITAMREKGLLR